MQGWGDVYYFCGNNLQYCTCDFRWNYNGWTKAVVLWSVILSAALGIQKLIIQLFLDGLLPGEQCLIFCPRGSRITRPAPGRGEGRAGGGVGVGGGSLNTVHCPFVWPVLSTKVSFLDIAVWPYFFCEGWRVLDCAALPVYHRADSLTGLIAFPAMTFPSRIYCGEAVGYKQVCMGV